MPTPTELDLRVDGMTCAACTRRVQKALERVEGVSAVEVDLVRERARVVGTNIALPALLFAAEQAGYKLTPPAAAGEAPPPTRISPLAPLSALGLAAGLTALPFFWPMTLGRMGVELVLASIVTFGLGGPSFRRAFDEIRGRALGMNVLVAGGAGASIALHLVAMRDLSAGHHAMEGMAHSDAATAATIVAFVLLGKWLEARARRRVQEALDALETPLDADARVVRHGAEGNVATADLRVGDVVIVPPHGVLPADGVVLASTIDEKAPLIDEAWLTGEAHPVERGPGATVHAGTVNTTRGFRMRVSALGKDTRRAQIAGMVTSAFAQKSPLAVQAERWSARVVPLVLLVAGATLIALLASGQGPTAALTRAVTVLVIACPCALGLATPTAIAAALGSALRAGILVQKPAQLELLAHARTFVFDKTGTLTEGRPRPVAIEATDPDALFCLAAAVETESEHPLGRAIFEEAMRRKLVLPEVRALTHVPSGVEGFVGTERIRVDALPESDATPATEAQRRSGASIVRVTRDGTALGWMAIADALRPETPAVIEGLRARGIAVHLLSGDHALAAQARGLEAGLDAASIEGGLTPDDKQRRLHQLAQQGPVVMVGDGINDAPALAAASVGIAIGRGAKIAIETAGLTLEGGLTRLLPALDLAQRTQRVVRENLFLAFAYNVVALPLAAFGALSAIGGPSVAALAMACSSIAVVLSSLRLTRPLTV